MKITEKEWMEWHEREHAKYEKRLERIAEAMSNEARDYWINGNFDNFVYTPSKEGTTMKKSNHTVGEVYKTPRIHDPHNKYTWEGNRPWWVRPFQVLAFVVIGGGTVTFFWFVATLMLLLESYPS